MRHARVIVLAALAVTLVMSGSMSAQKPPVVQVYKDATCGCCAVWVEHLRRNGFAPASTNVDDLAGVKKKHGVPAQAQSCHTAIVGGYVIEGHVPAAEIHRLLKAKPAGIVGLAVAGMPIGSPGMEGLNPRPYNVLAFDKQGRTTVFSTQRP